MAKNNLQKFLFPELTVKFFLRVSVIVITVVILFTYIFIPFRINGFSMMPTYKNGGFNFCFTLRYLFSPPKSFDVVTIRLAGSRVMLLKRIVATEGETVEFKKGHLYVNGKKINEPYVTGRQKWDLLPRTVKKDHVYVVGDNRNVPMKMHDFGQTPVYRIIGAPLW
jgi:signal peptidase I